MCGVIFKVVGTLLLVDNYIHVVIGHCSYVLLSDHPLLLCVIFKVLVMLSLATHNIPVVISHCYYVK
jgi:hypothetical protein